MPMGGDFFLHPEDGSEDRFIKRKAKVPWTTHTTWWLIHNAVAHPLIAFLPITPFFEFHDYTARRMHGIKNKPKPPEPTALSPETLKLMSEVEKRYKLLKGDKNA